MAQQIQSYSPARDILAASTLNQGNGGLLSTTAPHVSNAQDGGAYSKSGSPITSQEMRARQKGQADMIHGQDRVPQMQASVTNSLESANAQQATAQLRADELKNGYVAGIMTAGHAIQPGFGNATASLSDSNFASQAHTAAAAQKLLAFGSGLNQISA